MFILKFDFVLSFQVSVYGVPYALAALGKSWAESLSANTLTEMYRAAVKKEELDRTGAETVDARIQDNPKGFRVVLAAFGSTVVNYASQNRGNVANILHFVFSTPRGSGTIPADMKNRIDALHAILGLAKGDVLLNHDQPLNFFYPSFFTFYPQNIFYPLFLNEDGRIRKNRSSKLHYRF